MSYTILGPKGPIKMEDDFENHPQQLFLAQSLQQYENDVEEKYQQLRTYRNRILNETDWRVGNDSPLTVGIQSSWRTYRNDLRNITKLPGAPDKISESDWPMAPGQVDTDAGAHMFMLEHNVAVGVGTTSYISTGSTITSVEIISTSVATGISTDIISFASTVGIQTGDILVGYGFTLGDNIVVNGIGTDLNVTVSTARSFSNVNCNTGNRILVYRNMSDGLIKQDGHHPTLVY